MGRDAIDRVDVVLRPERTGIRGASLACCDAAKHTDAQRDHCETGCSAQGAGQAAQEAARAAEAQDLG